VRKVKFDRALCIGCKQCQMACLVRHSDSADTTDIKYVGGVTTPRLRVKYDDAKEELKVLRCVMCKKPKCIEACEYEGIVQDDDGYVHFTDKCTKCLACVEACPFGAIFVEGGIPCKCDLCRDWPEPACVQACKVNAMTFVEG
jgi:carbon-monoxide dehydrogenase iron sulfur subunit